MNKLLKIKTALVSTLLVSMIGIFVLDYYFCVSGIAYASKPLNIILLKGDVKILNTNTPEEAKAIGITIIFQKKGCNSCIVAARTDIDGKYQILLGEGTYKVIVKNPTPEQTNWLAKKQSDTVEVINHYSGVVKFDIELDIPET